jgi:hypothetical protein
LTDVGPTLDNGGKPNVGPTWRQWATLRWANVGFRRRANDPNARRPNMPCLTSAQRPASTIYNTIPQVVHVGQTFNNLPCDTHQTVVWKKIVAINLLGKIYKFRWNVRDIQKNKVSELQYNLLLYMVYIYFNNWIKQDTRTIVHKYFQNRRRMLQSVQISTKLFFLTKPYQCIWVPSLVRFRCVSHVSWLNWNTIRQ